MSEERTVAWVKDIWKVDVESSPPASKRRLLVEETLEGAWREARDNLARALQAGALPVDKLLYHPHLFAFETFIKNAWDDLADEAVFDEALEFIEQMDDQPVAAVLGYQELLSALALGGDRHLLAVVADLQKQYMDTNHFWESFQERVRRETQVHDGPASHIPGGIPNPPEPDQPLDEPAAADDPFAG